MTSTPEEQLLKVFVHEASDQVDALEAALLELEERPGDLEQLNKVLGIAHSLKGAAGTVGLGALAELVHETEGALDDVRKERAQASPELFNRVFEVLDGIRGNVVAVSKNDYQVDKMEDMRRSLRVWRDAASTRETKAPVADAPSDGFQLGEYDRVRIGVLRKQQKRLYRVDVVAATVEGEGQARNVVQLLRRLGDVVTSVSGPVAPGDERLRVSALVGSAQERDLFRAAVCEAGFPEATVVEWTPPQDAPATSRHRAEHVQDTIKVAVERLDRLMEMVGELVIVESIVKNAPEIAGVGSVQVRASMRLLTRISLDLQDTAMSMRMVPLRGAFRRLERLVRDLARSTGKQVRLELEGETTEVDRAIADRLGEPLMHLVRNSVDHGIEPEAERREQGKSAVSTIRMRAAQEGGAIVVEVSDDGKGLDRDSILAKARALGLVTRDGPLADGELMSLIFTPSFSTAKQVTEISGRGIGLDVVKRVVESMRGRISVVSVPGKGTTFRIVLPLTLAIINGTLIQCGGERYVLPTLSIVECLSPAPVDFAQVGGGIQLLKLRGDLVPLLHLGKALGVKTESETTQPLVVVVESTGRRIGLFVDDVLTQQQVVIKSLVAPSFDTRLFSGAAILSDGRIGLILNVDELTARRRVAGTSGEVWRTPSEPAFGGVTS